MPLIIIRLATAQATPLIDEYAGPGGAIQPGICLLDQQIAILLRPKQNSNNPRLYKLASINYRLNQSHLPLRSPLIGYYRSVNL